MLLGGEKSRWSNIAVAGAMARLMTGLDVSAKLASSVQVPGQVSSSAPPPSALSDQVLDPGVRRRVLHAMELVIEGQSGTARRLSDEIVSLRAALAREPGGAEVDVYAFAKTGTPTVTVYPPATGVAPYRRLVSAGLAWDPATRQFVIPPQAAQLLRTMPDADSLLRLITQDTVQAYVRQPGENAPAPLYLDGRGRLQVANSGDGIDQNGAALLLGILVVPRHQGRLASEQDPSVASVCYTSDELRRRIQQIPPTAFLDQERAVALTMALYIDDLPKGNTSQHAVRLMEQMFPSIQEFVLREWRRKNPAPAP
jgi:hypothetical protein